MTSRVISREVARAKGLVHFYTGKPCVKGHVYTRQVSTGACRKCRKDSLKAWIVLNKCHLNEKNKKYWNGFKLPALQAYSKKKPECSCCGEDGMEFLTIDHKNNDGNKHRLEIGGKTGVRFYKWLRDNNFPKGFQVLCFNCNCAKSIYGTCPHKKRKN